jgi:hypothetical protein
MLGNSWVAAQLTASQWPGSMELVRKSTAMAVLCGIIFSWRFIMHSQVWFICESVWVKIEADWNVCFMSNFLTSCNDVLENLLLLSTCHFLLPTALASSVKCSACATGTRTQSLFQIQVRNIAVWTTLLSSGLWRGHYPKQYNCHYQNIQTYFLSLLMWTETWNKHTLSFSGGRTQICLNKVMRKICKSKKGKTTILDTT